MIRESSTCSVSLVVVLHFLFPLIACAQEQLATAANVDLTSSDRNLSASAVLRSEPSKDITLGGQTRTVTATDKLTGAEFVALSQVVSSGAQTLSVNSGGIAYGGALRLSTLGGVALSNLTIASGVTLIHDFAESSVISVSGNLSNYGTVLGYSSAASTTLGVISGTNLSNFSGATISTALADIASMGLTTSAPTLSLSLVAAQTIFNAGTISTSGNLSAIAGLSITNSQVAGMVPSSTFTAVMQSVGNLDLRSAAIYNSGVLSSQSANLALVTDTLHNTALIEAVTGSISMQSLTGNSLNILSQNGTFSALQNIVFSTAYGGGVDSSLVVRGGDISANSILFSAPGGLIDVDSNTINGAINLEGRDAIVGVQSGNLSIHSSVLSADPVFFNVNGSLDLTSAQLAPTGGEQFIALAGGDVTSNTIVAPVTLDATGTTAPGGKVLIGAGVTFQGTTITGKSTTGGSVVLPFVSVLTNSNDITIVANAGSKSIGDVIIGNITSDGLVAVGAPAGSAGSKAGAISLFGNSIQTGAISAAGGAGLQGASGVGSRRPGGSGGVGGAGGNVVISAVSSIQLGSLRSTGGAGGAGGIGDSGSVFAGLQGLSGGAAGEGGAGGTLEIAGGNVNVSSVTLTGGQGGRGGDGGHGGTSQLAGGAAGDGGTGGAGGSSGITNIKTSGTLQIGSVIAVVGGAGGDGGKGALGGSALNVNIGSFAGVGGQGGAGGAGGGTGAVTVQTIGNFNATMLSVVSGNGGLGGAGGSGGTLAAIGSSAGGGQGGIGGRGGTGGRVSLNSSQLTISTVNVESGNGGPGGAGGDGGAGLLAAGGMGGNGAAGGAGGLVSRLEINANVVDVFNLRAVAGNGGSGGGGGASTVPVHGPAGSGGAGGAGGFGGLISVSATNLVNLGTTVIGAGRGGNAGATGASGPSLSGGSDPSGTRGGDGGDSAVLSLVSSGAVSTGSILIAGGAGGAGSSGSNASNFSGGAGFGGDGGSGGDGGGILVEAAGNISFGSTIVSQGGTGGSAGNGGLDGLAGYGGAGGSGGNAGSISIRSTGGNVVAVPISSTGGSGAAGGNGGTSAAVVVGKEGGAGGNGGTGGSGGGITIFAAKDVTAVSIISSGGLGALSGFGGGGSTSSATGGRGGSAGRGGDGGRSGDVTVTSYGALNVASVATRAGDGGNGNSAGNGGGSPVGGFGGAGGAAGDGGAAGSLALFAGQMNVTGSLSATGGNGGNGGAGGAGGDKTPIIGQSPGNGGNGAGGGTGGASGFVYLEALGSTVVNGSVTSRGGNGGGGGAGGVRGAGGGGLNGLNGFGGDGVSPGGFGGKVLFSSGPILIGAQTIAVAGSVSGNAVSFITNTASDAPVLIKPVNTGVALQWLGGAGLTVNGMVTAIAPSTIIQQDTGDLDLSAVAAGKVFSLTGGTVSVLPSGNLFKSGSIATGGRDLVVVAGESVVVNNPPSGAFIDTSGRYQSGHVIIAAGENSALVPFSAANPWLVAGTLGTVTGGDVALSPISIDTKTDSFVFLHTSKGAATGALSIGPVQAGTERGAGVLVASGAADVTISGTSSAGTALLSTSGGSIGSGAMPALVRATNLQVYAAGSAMLTNSCDIQYVLGAKTAALELTVAPPIAGVLRVIGTVSGGDVSIRGTNNSSVNLYSDINATGLVTLAVQGSGIVSQFAGKVSGARLSLLAGSGFIGSSSAGGLSTSVANITADGSGTIRINNEGSANVGAVTAQNFYLTTTGAVSSVAIIDRVVVANELNVFSTGDLAVNSETVGGTVKLESANNVLVAAPVRAQHDLSLSSAAAFGIQVSNEVSSVAGNVSLAANFIQLTGAVNASAGEVAVAAVSNAGLTLTGGLAQGKLSATRVDFQGAGGPVNVTLLEISARQTTANGAAINISAGSSLNLGRITAAGPVDVSASKGIVGASSLVFGTNVTLTSSGGSIGTGGAGAPGNVVVSADQLDLHAFGSATILSERDIRLGNVTVGASESFVLQAKANSNVDVSATVSAGTGSVTLIALEGGSIRQFGAGGKVSASNITLNSGHGEIGASGQPLNISGKLLFAGTGGSGGVYLSQTGDLSIAAITAGGPLAVTSTGSVDVIGNVTARSITLVASGGMNVGNGLLPASGNITSSAGSTSLIASGAPLVVRPGTRILAQEGDLLLNHTDAISGSIIIGQGAQLTARTTGAVTGLVNVVVGPLPPTLSFGTAPPTVTTATPNFGLIYFGANGISAPTPNPVLTADAGQIVFDKPANATTLIRLESDATVTSKRGQPVVPTITSLDLQDVNAVRVLQILQAEGHVGGALVTSGGIAIGGNAIISPQFLAPALSAANIPANVTVSFSGFAAGDGVNVSLTGTSTRPSVSIAGTQEFIGSSATGNLSIVSTNSAPGLLLFPGATLRADGSLNVTSNRDMFVGGNLSAQNLTLSGAGSNILLAGSVQGNQSVSVQTTGGGTILQSAGTVTGSEIRLVTATSPLGTVSAPITVSGSLLRVTSSADVFVRSLTGISLTTSKGGDGRTFSVSTAFGGLTLVGDVLADTGRLGRIEVNVAGHIINGPGAGSYQAKSIALTSGGNIGGPAAGAAIVTRSDELSLRGTDPTSAVFVRNEGNVVLLSSASNVLSLSTNNGAIDVAGIVNAAQFTSLDSARTISGAGLIMSAAVQLQARAGNIGSASTALSTSALSLRSSSSGDTFINSTSFAGLALIDSTSAGVFNLRAVGTITGKLSAAGTVLSTFSRIGDATDPLVLSTSALSTSSIGGTFVMNDKPLVLETNSSLGAFQLSNAAAVSNAGSLQALRITLELPLLRNFGEIKAVFDVSINSNNEAFGLPLVLASGSTISGFNISLNPLFANDVVTLTRGTGSLFATNAVSINGGGGAVDIDVDEIRGCILANGSSIQIETHSGGCTICGAAATRGDLAIAALGGPIQVSGGLSAPGLVSLASTQAVIIDSASTVSGGDILLNSAAVSVFGAVLSAGDAVFQTNAANGVLNVTLYEGASIRADSNHEIRFNPVGGATVSVTGQGTLSAGRIEFDHAVGAGVALIDVKQVTGQIDGDVGVLSVTTSVGDLTFAGPLFLSGVGPDGSGGKVSLNARGGLLAVQDIFVDGFGAGQVRLNAANGISAGVLFARGYDNTSGGGITATTPGQFSAVQLGAGSVGGNGGFISIAGASILLTGVNAQGNSLDVQSGGNTGGTAVLVTMGNTAFTVGKLASNNSVLGNISADGVTGGSVYVATSSAGVIVEPAAVVSANGVTLGGTIAFASLSGPLTATVNGLVKATSAADNSGRVGFQSGPDRDVSLRGTGTIWGGAFVSAGNLQSNLLPAEAPAGVVSVENTLTIRNAFLTNLRSSNSVPALPTATSNSLRSLAVFIPQTLISSTILPTDVQNISVDSALEYPSASRSNSGAVAKATGGGGALLVGRVVFDQPLLEQLSLQGISVERMAGERGRLLRGAMLVAPDADLVIDTAFGALLVAAGAVAFIDAGADSLAVLTLYDKGKTDVLLRTKDQAIAVSIGEMLVLGSATAQVGSIAKRELSALKVGGAKGYLAEYSLLAATTSLRPLRVLFSEKVHSSVKGKILKSAAILHLLRRGKGPFRS